MIRNITLFNRVTHSKTSRLPISRFLLRPLSSLVSAMTSEATGPASAATLDGSLTYKPRYIDVSHRTHISGSFVLFLLRGIGKRPRDMSVG